MKDQTEFALIFDMIARVAVTAFSKTMTSDEIDEFFDMLFPMMVSAGYDIKLVEENIKTQKEAAKKISEAYAL